MLLTLLVGAGALLGSVRLTDVAAGARGFPTNADQTSQTTFRPRLLEPFHPLQDVTFDAAQPSWNGQPIQVEHRLTEGGRRQITIGTFTFSDVVIPPDVTVSFQGFDIVVFQSTGDLEINGPMDVSGGNGQPGVRDGGGQGGNGGASRGGAPEGGEPGEGGHPWTSVQRRADPTSPYDFMEGTYGNPGDGDVAGCGPPGGESFDIPLTQLRGGGSGAGGGNGTRGADGQGHILDGFRPEFGKRGQSELALQQQASIRVDHSLGGEPLGEPVFSTDPGEWCSASGGAGGDGPAMLIRRRLAGGGGGGGGAGGAIFLNAQGTIRINQKGAVKANGGNGGDGTRGTFSGGGGGGAGGFIRIEAQMLEMNGGVLEAHGGRGGR